MGVMSRKQFDTQLMQVLSDSYTSKYSQLKVVKKYAFAKGYLAKKYIQPENIKLYKISLSSTPLSPCNIDKVDIDFYVLKEITLRYFVEQKNALH